MPSYFQRQQHTGCERRSRTRHLQSHGNGITGDCRSSPTSAKSLTITASLQRITFSLSWLPISAAGSKADRALLVWCSGSVRIYSRASFWRLESAVAVHAKGRRFRIAVEEVVESRHEVSVAPEAAAADGLLDHEPGQKLEVECGERVSEASTRASTAPWCAYEWHTCRRWAGRVGHHSRT